MKKNENYKNFYEVISMNKETDILIVDPYAINLEDFRSMDVKVKNIVRVRRPFWGKGNISEFINKVDPTEFKMLLEKLMKGEN